jgi:NADPH-dependent curcumin reductase CurA
MTKRHKITIEMTEAEKDAIAAKAKELKLSASAYGYIKLFAPASHVIRSTDQMYAYGESGLAMSSSQRIAAMVQALAERLGPEDPAAIELIEELGVLERHARGAYNYLLGDLRASQTNQGE